MVAEPGRVDLLVHAAGVMAGTFVRKESVETFESVLRTNLTSAFVVAHACLPVMAPAGGWCSCPPARPTRPSPAGRPTRRPRRAQRLRRALAKEVERDGIAVHVVTTGPVATPMLDDVHFPMRTLAAADVVQAITWLDTLPGNVVLPELEVSSVGSGPFAPEAFVPEAARKLGRTELAPE